ncbi:MAG: M42 family metallopeptidase [Pirellulales bacterium]|nr:M42 family metallopeptidase [Pirellulales bacterium]
MNDSAHKFLKDILETPSPSGYEAPVQQVVRDYVKDVADEVRTDLHGNVIIVKNPDAPVRLMFAGHADQIGFLVTHIDEQGFVYVQSIGGWDPQVLLGQRMTLWSSDGPVEGAIARKPIHLLTEEERKQVPKIKDLWLDIGAKDKEDAEKLVRIGDSVTPKLGYQAMINNIAYSPAMDNKTGVWVCVEGFRRAAEAGVECGVYCVSTVQEEIGLRGAKTSAYGIDPQVGIAVDVTHATDCPTIDKKQEGDIALGDGPVIYRGPNMNPKVVDRLCSLADEKEMAYQLAASGRAQPNDSNVMQTTRAGVATGLVSVPNRYMHSPVEMVSLDDCDRGADLLAAFAVSLKESDDFTP